MQVLVRRETSALLMLLQKLFAAALNLYESPPQEMQPLVRAVWELLRHVIHEGGPRAKSSAVSCGALHCMPRSHVLLASSFAMSLI